MKHLSSSFQSWNTCLLQSLNRMIFKWYLNHILFLFPLWVRGHPRMNSLPLLQVVEGDQNRIRAHQRLKNGDLRRTPYLLFGSFMVVVLAYSQFPYGTKEQNTIPEEGPPVWSGKYENRPLQRNRKGIRFWIFFAKIKSNMKATNRLRRRTTRSAP